MAIWNGKTKGGVLGYKIFITLLKRFGLGPAHLLLYFVVPYYVVFDPKRAAVSYRFFKDKIGYKPIKSLQSVFQNTFIFGQVLLDKFAMMTSLRTSYTFEFDGEERLQKMADSGKGGIIITAHIGNWEVASQLLDRLSTKVNVIMFDAEYRKIKHLISSQLGERGFNIIPLKKDMSHIFEISKALKAGELLCIQGDRYLETAPTLDLKFFDELALFPKGPFDLASRLKVPVSFAFAMKAGKRHYKLNATSPYTALNSEQLANEFVGIVEEKVKEYPLQWFNFYDFWKH